MKRIQVIVDDQLAHVMSKDADQYGLSLSALARIVLKDFFNKKKALSVLDQGLLDITHGNVEKVSLAQFKKELNALKHA